MDLDTLIQLGSFCELLMEDPNFQTISALFENTAVAEMLATKPHETKSRESIYARIIAHREFLSMMAEFIQEKRRAETPVDELTLIDDPSVHDIYKDI